MKVDAYIPSGEPLWRSVRVQTPMSIDGAWQTGARFKLRNFLREVAKEHGIPSSRVRVQGRTQTNRYIGYIHVYRGVPTKEERFLFKCIREDVTRRIALR